MEPDPENYLDTQSRAVRSAGRGAARRALVQARTSRVAESDYRGGGAWSRQVGEPAGRGSESVEAIDIPSLMERFHLPRISLLKVDIEGAETVVFSERTSEWLPRVDALVVELHDDSILARRRRFQRAIAPEGFEVTESGELTICRRRPAKPGSGQ